MVPIDTVRSYFMTAQKHLAYGSLGWLECMLYSRLCRSALGCSSQHQQRCCCADAHASASGQPGSEGPVELLARGCIAAHKCLAQLAGTLLGQVNPLCATKCRPSVLQASIQARVFGFPFCRAVGLGETMQGLKPASWAWIPAAAVVGCQYMALDLRYIDDT